MTEIMGVLGGITGYLILIWFLSWGYGKFQDSNNKNIKLALANKDQRETDEMKDVFAH